MAVFQQRLANAEDLVDGTTDARARIAALQEALAETTTRTAILEARIEQLSHAESCAAEQEQRARAAEARSEELGDNAHHWWLRSCALEAENNTLRQSWSWRITAPVRWVGGLGIHGGGALRRGANWLVRVGINLFRCPLTGLMRGVLSQPALSEPLNRMLLRYPPLHQWLLGIAQRGGVLPGAPTYRPSAARNTTSWEPAESAELSALTPRARRIYRELITAIEERRPSDG